MLITSHLEALSGTKKYDRGLRQLCHSDVHWLDVGDWVTFKLCMTVYKCLHNQALDYMCASCSPKSPMTAPSFGQPTRRAKNTARYVQPSCFCCGWSDRLEHTRQQSVPSRSQHHQLRSPTYNASLSEVLGAPSALEALSDNALYKLTLTLTLYNKLYQVQYNKKLVYWHKQCIWPQYLLIVWRAKRVVNATTKCLFEYLDRLGWVDVLALTGNHQCKQPTQLIQELQVSVLDTTTACL